MAARGGANTAPTTPMVRGKMRIVLPFLSSILILRMLPWWINSLTFLSNSSPLTLKDSVFEVFVLMVIKLLYYDQGKCQ